MAEQGPGGGPTGHGAGDGRAVLVCSPGEAEASWDACVDLLAPGDAEGVDLLYVCFSGDPTARLDALRERGVPIERTAVASIGADVDGADPDRSYTLGDIEAVEELSDLGMYVRDVVFDWADDDAHTAVCFDSITEMLSRADLELTFEFLLVLVEGIRPSGAAAHFHFDPDAHDAQTRRTLEHLFDETISHGGE